MIVVASPPPAPFLEVFWPGFLAAIAAFDDDGAPIGDNELFAILFEYGVRKANTNHRLAQGLSFPQCLPDGFVDSIEVRGREKLLQQQRRQCRVEAVADWVKAKGMSRENCSECVPAAHAQQ